MRRRTGLCRNAALALVTVSALFAGSACKDQPDAEVEPPTQAPAVELEPAVAEALSRAKAALDADPGAANATHLARVLQAHQMYLEAADAYAEAAGMPGADVFACTYLAGVSLEKRDAEKAQKMYAQALVLRADYAPLLIRAGVLQERFGDPTAARALFERAEKLAPSPHAELGIARAWLAEGQAQKAYAVLRQAPGGTGRQWFETLARACYSTGREAEARRAAATAATAGDMGAPEDPVLGEVLALGTSFTHRIARAQERYRAGDLVRALAAIEEALAARPDHADALELRAWTLARLERNDEALAAFEAAVAVAPRDGDILTGLAKMLAAAGRFEEARAAYARALAVSPGQTSALLGMADLCKRSDPVEARRLVVEALRADPTQRDAQRALADLLIAAGDFEKGTRYLEEAMSSSSDPARARTALDNALR